MDEAQPQDIIVVKKSFRQQFDKEVIRAASAEFVGMFLFQFIGGESAANSALYPTVGAIGNGFALGSVVAATANYSGGHINPGFSFIYLASILYLFVYLLVCLSIHLLSVYLHQQKNHPCLHIRHLK